MAQVRLSFKQNHLWAKLKNKEVYKMKACENWSVSLP